MAPRRASQNLHIDGQAQPVDGLLESQERAILEGMASLEMPHSQRAAVLLALDSGATQAEAGERVGMSSRQARYWRDRFIQHRLDIFPQGLLAQIRVGPLPEKSGLMHKQENEVMSTVQEEPENMTDEPREPDSPPEELQVATTLVEEREKAEVDKKTKKAKAKKKSKKDKKRKKGKKKKSARKAGAKKKSTKSKKKRRKK